MTSKAVVVEEANVEKLVETNQFLAKANNLIETSTISTDKVELIELPKNSVLPTGFRFIDLSFLSDVLFLLVSELLDSKYSEASRQWKQEKRTCKVYVN